MSNTVIYTFYSGEALSMGSNLIFTWADKTTDSATDHPGNTRKVVCHMLAMPEKFLSNFILLDSESAFEWLTAVDGQAAVRSVQRQTGTQWRDAA